MASTPPTAGGPSPESPLQQLAARAAAARQRAAAASEGNDGIIQDVEVQRELQALQLEARDAAEALLGRMRHLAAFRHSQAKHLGQLAGVGQDGAPRHTPLLRQIVGESGLACWQCALGWWAGVCVGLC